MRPKPLVLIIMDGVGAAFHSEGNAVSIARPNFLEQYWSNYPHGYLNASEEYVGLPKGTKGNSEVGHANIGAGKIVYQSLLRIDNSIALDGLTSNTTIKEAVNKAVAGKRALHLMGLLSDGGTHAHINHFEAILKLIAQYPEKPKVYIHVFTDGRDAEFKSAEKYLSRLENICVETGVGKIATIIGRYFAMDRNENWDRSMKAYKLLTNGEGKKVGSYKEALEDSYNQNITDEFIEPYLIDEEGIVHDSDSLLFLNFRADRAIQLTTLFVDPLFNKADRVIFYPNLCFCAMMSYSKKLDQLTKLIFPKNDITLPIGRVLSEYNLTQVRIAESEKYPHVTYFLNGGRNIIFPGEDRVEVPSATDVATYDEKPEMSALQVTAKALEKIESEKYDFIAINYANGDMVGHTGNLIAGVKAIKILNLCIQKVVSSVVAKGGVTCITADHGNIEEMLNPKTGEIDTEHSLNPVPIMIVGSNPNPKQLLLGKLADIAPTLLSMMEIPIPSEMTGNVLLK